ncbi:nicotinamide riboside transporter PnuC [Frateuria aurantia]
MSPLELLAAVLSAWGVWLTARRRLLGFPVSLLACLLYAGVFLRSRLYSDSLLQLLFCTFVIYGWLRWRQHLDASRRVQIAALSAATARRHLMLGAIGGAVLGAWMQHYTDAALPWLDAGLTSYSLVAQYWQARRYLANWPLWIGIDVLYVGEYASKSLWLTALLYAGFVVLAIAGWRGWKLAEAESTLQVSSCR